MDRFSREGIPNQFQHVKHPWFGRSCRTFQVKTCFMVLDDDGSNEVTPFEFKQPEARDRPERRMGVVMCFSP